MKMKKLLHRTDNISLIILAVIFTILYCSEPAFGIKFTNVQHLYDITFDMSEPSDVAVSRSGQIYIVDGVNNRVVVSNKRGKVLFTFGKKGSGKGQMLFPLGIFVDSAGNVYLADSGNHRIQIFDPFGKYKAEINIPPFEGIPADPTDLTVDESGNRIFIVDNNNHHILVYDLNSLALIDTYGTPGIEKRQFRYPFLISSDKDGYLYIVDVINTRVQVLNSDGKFVQFIGGWGVKKGEFFRPKGVALDSTNRVYVSDGYMGVIQVFKPNGEFDSVLSNTDKLEVKKFKTPVGIYIDSNNRLYVVEMFANRVGVYSIEN
jgi:DNA-binding beta-propeller fold protein YncE